MCYQISSSYKSPLYSSHAAYPYDYNHYSPSAYTDLEVGSRHLQSERKFLRSNALDSSENLDLIDSYFDY